MTIVDFRSMSLAAVALIAAATPSAVQDKAPTLLNTVEVRQLVAAPDTEDVDALALNVGLCAAAGCPGATGRTGGRGACPCRRRIGRLAVVIIIVITAGDREHGSSDESNGDYAPPRSHRHMNSPSGERLHVQSGPEFSGEDEAKPFVNMGLCDYY